MTETRAEAQRLVDEGRVLIVFRDDFVTEGRIQKNGGLYHTFVYADGVFVCNCSWGRQHEYTDDLCAHAEAVQLIVEKEGAKC